jgi:putative ABC transport system permease protein
MMKNFEMKDKESMEDAKEEFNNISTYTIDDIENYADSSYVDDYYYTYEVSLNGSSIEKVSSDFSFGENDNKKDDKNDMGMQEESYDFTVTGYNSIASMSEFINGTYTMSEITDDAWDKIFTGNYVFINSELATLNEIELNDTITLIDSNSKTYKFTVIGIYEEEATTSDMPTDMFSNSANTIITGADYLVETFSENDAVNAKVTPTFILKSYDDVEDFQNELYEKGLDENYVIETNESEALSNVSGVSNVSSFAATFLVITLIIGAVVLFVINMINIRERKYEIGVLRTIGVSKFKLTSQFVIELTIVAFVSIILGTAVGAVSSKSVGNYLLSNEINKTNETTNEISNNFKMDDQNGPMGKENGDRKDNINGVVAIQAYDSIDAVVNIKVLLELILIGLVLVLVSSLASMVSIERFSPLAILKERS